MAKASKRVREKRVRQPAPELPPTRQQLLHAQWAARHPARAAAEARLHHQNSEAQAKFGRKPHGTAETLHKASTVQQGALARLYERGHISLDQLAWSQSIRVVAERLTADVRVGSLSLETRVDCGFQPGAGFYEKLGAVRAEVTYTRWRAGLLVRGVPVAPVLALVVEDQPCSTVARRFGMRDTTTRQLLVRALDLWGDLNSEVCDEIDEAALLAAQAGMG